MKQNSIPVIYEPCERFLLSQRKSQLAQTAAVLPLELEEQALRVKFYQNFRTQKHALGPIIQL